MLRTLRLFKPFPQQRLLFSTSTQFKMPKIPYSQLEPLSNPTEESKRLSAYKAVDENFSTDYKIIGIGSGSTVIYVAERIAQLDNKEDFICIPTGFQSKNLIVDNGLRLGAIEQYPELDIAFDGADEVDNQVNAIKGGGACLFQEKLVAFSAKKFILVADYRKKSPNYLGVEWVKGVPIEVVPISYIHITKELEKLGALSITLRQGGSAKAGPVITDNMNFIIDAHFGPIQDPKDLHFKIKSLVGVVDTGLFIGHADKAYFGEQDGSVTIRTIDGDKTSTA
ncbi:Ribose-5-phosphate isomerase [Wickerhamomyces ciferrii]|uniref:Ribose-5-phosphate isomerase n=1 Tax=Wickerhamomyces ciferrii (strain ATCC 14091 / BCRC 22168 / CBS 111 / JCM 3599 / NBRC 0793 / NRRL Y-1031 F-60-10) TaxID=1206466 RepID=K0KIV4_WICCF|nr:Ribose-5-phosphate isomerase [Wickerhamomyces ciferrii]CCH41073.1 Ribose-5-phosphate isomerase [Wickerhamomyces ciferrii]